MKTIKVWEKIIELNIGKELTVKDLRKIQPIISNQKPWQEIEMVVKLLKALSNLTEEEIDWFTINEFTKISEQITDVLNMEESKKKISK